MLAVAGDHLGADGRSVAGQAVVLVVAVSILIVAVFTTNSYGMWGGGWCDAGCCRSSEPAGGGQTAAAAAEGGHLSLGLGRGQLGLPPGLAHTAPTVGVMAGDHKAKLLPSYHLPASDRLSFLKPAFCRLTISLSGSM